MVYMLGADWQADITHLVLDQLKVDIKVQISVHNHTYTNSSWKEYFNLLENIVIYFSKSWMRDFFLILSIMYFDGWEDMGYWPHPLQQGLLLEYRTI